MFNLIDIFIKTHSTSIVRFFIEQILFLLLQAIPSVFGILLRIVGYKLIIKSKGIFGIEENVKITHPAKLYLHSGVYIGKNSFIGASSLGINIGENTIISDNAYINVFRYMPGEIAMIDIGKNCFFATGMTMHGHNSIHIGDGSIFGPRCVIVTGAHGTINAETQYRFARIPTGIPVRIGQNCWVGANVTILPGVSIGDNAVIGAGSTVTHDIPSYAVAWGSPARTRRMADASSLKDCSRELVIPEVRT